jgi:hypothetical protein
MRKNQPPRKNCRMDSVRAASDGTGPALWIWSRLMEPSEKSNVFQQAVVQGRLSRVSRIVDPGILSRTIGPAGPNNNNGSIFLPPCACALNSDGPQRENDSLLQMRMNRSEPSQPSPRNCSASEKVGREYLGIVPHRELRGFAPFFHRTIVLISHF